MKRSPACDAIVKKWEGYHRALPGGGCEAYPDVAHGWDVATIGFGTTHYTAAAMGQYGRRKVRQGDMLTRDQAESERDAALDNYERRLDNLITAHVTQSMFDAMCSFAFNVGIGGAGKQIVRINEGKYEEAARLFDSYINANGRPFQGLINRRNDEEALFRQDGMSPGVQPEGRPYVACPVPLPWSETLRRGDSGHNVYQLQCALIGLGYLDLEDGELVLDVFDGHLENTVTLLQSDVGIVHDGIVGPRTRSVLERLLTTARKPNAESKIVQCEFRMDLEPSQALRAGSLVFIDDTGSVFRKEPATSGLPGYQTREHLWTRGAGPLPSVSGQAIRFSDGYHLNTRGIEGWAFPMSPDPIMRGGVVGRSEIMLHRDANVPGTAGCIGLLLGRTDYQEFVKWAVNLGTLPLRVVYT